MRPTCPGGRYASRVTASHRFIDHTGDFGVELTADTLEEVHAELVSAWLALLVDDPRSVTERETRAIEVEGIDAIDILVNLGNELVFLFETEGWLPTRLSEISLHEGRLVGVMEGERYDEARHSIARPVKAVTHHGAELVEREGSLSARLVFDL
jgi:SHS2 domain-containing protein